MPQQRAAIDDTDLTQLRPVLGLFSATALVIGAVIGSGVFLKPKLIAIATDGYVGLILALWIGLGLINLCGALALAELSAMFPRAGGSYIFLREAYGPRWAFTWAWAEFFVIRSGAIATLASAMAVTLVGLARGAGYAPGAIVEHLISIGSIVVLTVVNVVGTRWGGGVQTVTTLIKGMFVAFLAALPFFALDADAIEFERLWPPVITGGLLAGIGNAISGIMWAYDGWSQLPVVAEEVRDPQRNVPRALFVGLVLIMVLYTGANLAYHLLLPIEVIETVDVPAAAAAQRLFPAFGERLTLSMLAVSVFGALSANILAGPRVLFAAARDHRILGPLGRINARFGTPVWAIVALSTWSATLVLASFLFYPDREKRLYDILSDYCVFGAALFYLAAVLAVFVLRKQRPEVPRPYRAWGYPLLPGIFVVSYCFVLTSMFWSAPIECTTGLALIATGIVCYGAVRTWERAAD